MQIDNNSITIFLPDNLQETNLEILHNEIKKNLIDLKDDGNKNITILLDYKNVKCIDIFGYQYVYEFYNYIKNILKINISIINKGKIIVDFENKFGLMNLL